MKEGDDGDVCIPVGVRIEAAPGLACQIETGIRSHWACQKELNNYYYSVLILRHCQFDCQKMANRGTGIGCMLQIVR